MTRPFLSTFLRPFVFCFAFCLATTVVTAGTIGEKRNLSTVLSELATQKGVDISFSPTLTSKVKVKVESLAGSVEEVLPVILKDSGFSFKVVSGKKFYVYPVHTALKSENTQVKVLEIPQTILEEKIVIDTNVLHNVVVNLKNVTDTAIRNKFNVNNQNEIYVEDASDEDEVVKSAEESAEKKQSHNQALFDSFSPNVGAGKIALKTNLVYDLTTTLNIGFEFPLSSRSTIDFSLSANPWNFGKDKRWRLYSIQPEYRFWIDTRFNGSFLGVHAHTGLFDTYGLFAGKKDERLDGWFAGLGASYGYQWVISDRIGIEAELGLGFAWTSCDRIYYGPTRAAVTFVYLIK